MSTSKYRPFVQSGDYKDKGKVTAKITELLESHDWSRELEPALGSRFGNEGFNHWFWGVQVKPYSQTQLGFFSFKKLVHYAQENLVSTKADIFFQFINMYEVKTGYSKDGVGYELKKSWELGGENNYSDVKDIPFMEDDDIREIYDQYVAGHAILFV